MRLSFSGSVPEFDVVVTQPQDNHNITKTNPHQLMIDYEKLEFIDSEQYFLIFFFIFSNLEFVFINFNIVSS